MKIALALFRWLTALTLAGLASMAILGAGAFLYIAPGLPSVESLREVRFQTPLRVYSREGLLIGEFGEKRASPLSYDEIPPLFVKAILAAEDDNFEQHHGVDIPGLLRAASQIVTSGHIRTGGSTITMQLARNFFLSSEKSFSRKFNEILLALRIEKALSKQEIFELYVNKIFLGNRAYGINAAAQVYYGKSIDTLSLAQWATIAGLPKAPSAYNPLANPKRSLERRNWILRRMHQLGNIDAATLQQALAQPEDASYHGPAVGTSAPYAAEMVRQEMLERFGPAAYERGLRVYTTIDSQLQQAAEQAVIKGLLAYDLRHGYRGPEKHLEDDEDVWNEVLDQTPIIAGLEPAVVTDAGGQNLDILLRSGERAEIKWEHGLKSARRYVNENSMGPAPRKAKDVARKGDLIRVMREGDHWRLSQLPAVQSALVALDSSNGALRALVGGLDFERSTYNRATQAQRQPGSNFKPFLYAAALEHGFTAASVVNDAPLAIENTGDGSVWRPQNSDDEFMGPMRLRQALVLSRNAVSVRLLQSVGMDKSLEYFSRFGFDRKRIPRELSIALGSHSVTPLSLAAGYASFSNGGFRVYPYIIDRIEDGEGKLLFEARPATACNSCNSQLTDKPAAEGSHDGAVLEGNLPAAKRIMDARVAFIMDSMLHDVTTMGTGKKAQELKRTDLAGKTGTTNGPTDAWFSGYAGEKLVATAWIGFDQNTPLGRQEYGGSAALPIWMDFMRVALDGVPNYQRPQPPGLVSMRIDPATGLAARPGQAGIFEVFKAEDVGGAAVSDEEQTPVPLPEQPAAVATPGTGSAPDATSPPASSPIDSQPAPLTPEEEQALLDEPGTPPEQATPAPESAPEDLF